jgi:coenzyme F420-reducing hydrogenase gamma subunit
MTKPKLGVFKFSSCDGCQLSILDAEEQLLALADSVEIREFLEATSSVKGGPYDIALVEGSISTPEEVERIIRIREESRMLVTIGACATAGGLQALRNWTKLDSFKEAVYPDPKVVRSLEKALPVKDFVSVDYELRGCPISKDQLLQFFAAVLKGVQPRLPTNSVCFDCKRKGNVCVVVASGVPCLGPITMAGCDAICPSYNRGCYGCFGPSDDVNLKSYSRWLERNGVDKTTIKLLVKGINSYSKEFRGWIESEE